MMWMIKYVQHLESLLGLSLRTRIVSAGIIKYLPEMINLKLNEPYVNWRLTVVQTERKTKITLYHVVECIFE